MGTVSPGEPPTGEEFGKKRKRIEGTTVNLFDDYVFPALKANKITTPTEAYLRIRSEVVDKKMVNLNRFKLEFFLNALTKKWSKASFNREGDLVIKVNDEETTNKLINTKKIGDYAVSITRHETLNCSKGVIFCPDLIGMTADEIKEGLQLFHPVKEVYIPTRIPRTMDGSQNIPNQMPTPFGLIIITFDQLEPPKRVTVGFRKVEVRPYIPNPRRCRKCQKLGHSTKFCQAKHETCGQCGQERGESHSCGVRYCVNCSNDDHASVDPKCPKWIMNKEVESIIVLQKKTKFEAKKLFYELYGSEINFVRLKNMSMADRLKATEVRRNSTKNPDSNNTTELRPAKSTTNNTSDPKVPTHTSTQTNTKTETIANKNKKPATITTRRLAVVSTQKPSSTPETTEDEVSVSKKTIANTTNNRLRLVYWEIRKDDISYYLRNLCSEGKTPVLDLKKFKKANEQQNEYISHLKEIFETSILEIKDQLIKTPECQGIEIVAKDGMTTLFPIFGTVKGNPNKEKDSISEESTSDMEVEKD